jgi:hypothetical protein
MEKKEKTKNCTEWWKRETGLVYEHIFWKVPEEMRWKDRDMNS